MDNGMQEVSQDFALLARRLEELSDAARAGDLERVTTLQAEHERLIQRIKARRVPLARHPAAGRIAKDIRAALECIRVVMPQIETLRGEVQRDATDTRMHRKVSQSYR